MLEGSEGLCEVSRSCVFTQGSYSLFLSGFLEEAAAGPGREASKKIPQRLGADTEIWAGAGFMLGTP